MAQIEYWQMVPADQPTARQLTMLATGDDEADVEALKSRIGRLHWSGAIISKWISDSQGSERQPDGKDAFRFHQRIKTTTVDSRF